MKNYFAPLVVLVFLGAGCTSGPSTTVLDPGKAPVNQPVNTPVVTPTPDVQPPVTTHEEPGIETGNEGTMETMKPATTDATWKTYTNSALGFSFMTPTKGRYAPEWEVKILNATDASLKDGCFLYPDDAGFVNMRATNDGVSFCMTESSDNGAGQHYVLNSYATTIGKKVVVIQFTKHTVNAAMMDCAGKMTEPYSTSSTACIPFVDAEYNATLDGIVGTFRMKP